GVPDMAVAGSHLHGAAYKSGVVIAYSGATGGVLHVWEGTTAQIAFGDKVASLGDIDGDNVPDIAISASLDDFAGDRTGSVQVFSGATGEAILRVDGSVEVSVMGESLAALGDIDGDGVPDFAAGGSHADIGTQG